VTSENAASVASVVHRLFCYCGFTQIQLTGTGLHVATRMRCWMCGSRVVRNDQPRPVCLLKLRWTRG
jgi:hypothetical protein